MTINTDTLPPALIVAGLIRLLDVRSSGDDQFIGARKPGGRGRVYGGQVIGQALIAASRTVDADRLVHSLHAYFIRAASEDHEISYLVSRDLDGGSFSNRRVLAVQQDKPVFSLTASFHRREPGFAHAVAMPDAPAAEALMEQRALARARPDMVPRNLQHFLDQPTPFDVRPVDDPVFAQTDDVRAPYGASWFRTIAPVEADQSMHRAILAMASDASLLATACMPHRVTSNADGFQLASIDHAVWFHDDVQVDDWLLYSTDSPWAGSARGFARGTMHARDGRLIASVAQEGLMRFVEK